MTFSDILESIRAQSANESAKGTKFEHLVKGFLLTERTYADLFAQVWLWNEFPGKNSLSTSGHDVGIDLVALTVDGDYWAVQCKCYADSTTISKGDVDTFLSTSSRSFTLPDDDRQHSFAHRLWVSTTNLWGTNAEESLRAQNPPVSRLNRQDLENADVDWQLLFEGQVGKEAHAKPKELRPHQDLAVRMAHKHYTEQGETRGKLIMACGTGKTFTSLKIVEKELDIAARSDQSTDPERNASLVLFMVPSIALLGQTLRAWHNDAQRPIRSICICSDSSASELASDTDSMYSAYDLPEPASTDIPTIVRQLRQQRHFNGMVVVFSTYQSIMVVSEAQKQIMAETNDEFGRFDFIVCDEAHRTTGAVALKEKSKKDDKDKDSGKGKRKTHADTGIKEVDSQSPFTLIHEEIVVTGLRRLYMTATPRIYGEAVKKSTKVVENNALLFSMDDESIYGREFHRVGFSYAVNQGMLTDYKVFVMAVEPGEVPDAMRDDLQRKNEDDLRKDALAIAKLRLQIRALRSQTEPDAPDGAKDLKTLSRLEAKEQKMVQDFEQKRNMRGLTALDVPIPELTEQDFAEGDDEETFDTSLDDVMKVIGITAGLSKRMENADDVTYNTDPRPMSRAIAFCSSIAASRAMARKLEYISDKYLSYQTPEERQNLVAISADHIDGQMNLKQRSTKLDRLARQQPDMHCHVLCNARCLSEGVDVPALDAVIFLSRRNSPVDIVQSIGRVMRTFHKGQSDEKKYGYIIIPMVIPNGVTADEALRNSQDYATVWAILNALRAHDDNFNAKINSITLNERPSTVIHIIKPPKPKPTDPSAVNVTRALQLAFDFPAEDYRRSIYIRLVEKCGERFYWENWGREVGKIAATLLGHVNELTRKDGRLHDEFQVFVSQLQDTINASINTEAAAELVVQHMITEPVFDALFADYNIRQNNAISRAMEHIVQLLKQESIMADSPELDRFYASVADKVGQLNIDNFEGKQKIIKDLYEKFFKEAFPLTVEQLGIVYTPTECVDFIIRSVEDILRREFSLSLSDQGVHVLDPFTGTGTFIARLLQSGIIRPEDFDRKYAQEIHCNEIVLLAYYIADVNIETVYNSMARQRNEQHNYRPFNGICLADTFNSTEIHHSQAQHSQELFADAAKMLSQNSEQMKRQLSLPVRVIMGNPPYSIGQTSATDNAQNVHYAHLDSREAQTYAANTYA